MRAGSSVFVDELGSFRWRDTEFLGSLLDLLYGLACLLRYYFSGLLERVCLCATLFRYTSL